MYDAQFLYFSMFGISRMLSCSNIGIILNFFLLVACFKEARGIETTLCHSYNASCGDECSKIVECPKDERRRQCFVFWKYEKSKEPVVTLKGCFSDYEQCFDKEQCLGEQNGKDHSFFFCCCEGDLCNQNFTQNPRPRPQSLGHLKSLSKFTPDSTNIQEILLIIMCTVISLTILIFIGLFAYMHYRRNKFSFTEVMTREPLQDKQAISTPGFLPIQLLEIVARGRFSTVWKGQYKTDTVAVKIFPVQQEASWLTERSVYQLPHMNHDYVLNFIAAEHHNNVVQAEFWLISSYHELGSLCDWLKANVLSWPDLCRIAESVASGLTHLHEEIPLSKTFGVKPSIAHRDIKSKNVLLKSDMTACIADLGLALVFEPGRPCGETHGQVGTRRYMAPEVLEGAITFSSSAFLRIDMYAFGLVLWELARRCTAQEGDVPEYALPFEEELGHHPSLEAMQYCVVVNKSRPKRPDEWRKHPGLAALCNTMEECWDHDPEARLTSSCVKERFIHQSRLLTQPKSPQLSPLISINGSDVVLTPIKLDSI